MRGNASRYPDKQISQQVARSQLATLLASCTPERLATFTVDSLCAMYRVDPKLIEYDLTIARQNRAIHG